MDKLRSELKIIRQDNQTVISISVTYLFRIEDARFHAILVALMSGFLAMVLFMIVINDRPFYGSVTIKPDTYRLILERLMMVSK